MEAVFALPRVSVKPFSLECEEYLFSLGFTKVPKDDEKFPSYRHKCKLGIRLDYFVNFGPAEEGALILDIYVKRDGPLDSLDPEDDGEYRTEISFITVKNINEVKFCVESTREWRKRMLL